MINSKKGGIVSQLITLVIIVLFVWVMIDVFFMDGRGLTKLKEKTYDVLNNPEIPEGPEDNLDFFRNNDLQLSFLGELQKALQNTADCDPLKGVCLTELPLLQQDGFYDGKYNLYLDQDGKDVNMRLTMYRKQEYEGEGEFIETPITATKIKNASLCVITDDSALYFYAAFNDIQAGETPDASNILPGQVTSIMISGGKDEETMRQIGYKVTTNEEYEWHDFIRKTNQTIPYVLRRDLANNQKFICFLPGYSDWGFGDVCNEPVEGFMDIDCFDDDEGPKSISGNLKSGLLNRNEYICPPAKLVGET